MNFEKKIYVMSRTTYFFSTFFLRLCTWEDSTHTQKVKNAAVSGGSVGAAKSKMCQRGNPLFSCSFFIE